MCAYIRDWLVGINYERILLIDRFIAREIFHLYGVVLVRDSSTRSSPADCLVLSSLSLPLMVLVAARICNHSCKLQISIFSFFFSPPRKPLVFPLTLSFLIDIDFARSEVSLYIKYIILGGMCRLLKNRYTRDTMPDESLFICVMTMFRLHTHVYRRGGYVCSSFTLDNLHARAHVLENVRKNKTKSAHRALIDCGIFFKVLIFDGIF